MRKDFEAIEKCVEDTAEAEAASEAEAEAAGNLMMTWCKLRDDEVCELCEGMNEFNNEGRMRCEICLLRDTGVCKALRLRSCGQR